jgi:site-specific recombinase XerD
MPIYARGRAGQPTAPSCLRRPRPLRRFPPEVLTDAEVRSLMDACNGPPVTALRNRALLAVLYRSGLRISEALDLRPKDVDAAGGALRVMRGKGGRDRTSGIDAGAVAVLAEWLAVRASLGLNGRDPVFCTTRGERLSGGYVRRLMRRLGDRAGIDKRVHAHGLRHTHAAQLRQEGVDIGIISRQLGHRSIATTALYLDHIAPFAVVEAMRGRIWRATA